MKPVHLQLETSNLRKVLKRLHYPLDIMLVCVRWYAAYPLSLHQLEEMMAKRGVAVDHATVHRWALKILPVLARVFRQRRHPLGRPRPARPPAARRGASMRPSPSRAAATDCSASSVAPLTWWRASTG
ncbi:hypothetical protein B0G76_5348 [Paraburkholderia sp. BL23I1N1]|nr:hypothetical protein B0G76_5348 [Paraburkholderia sp. BL23I1N1]